LRGERTNALSAHNLTSASDAAKRARRFDSAPRNEQLNRNGDPDVESPSEEDLKQKLDSLQAAYEEQRTTNSQLKRDHQEELLAINSSCKELEQNLSAVNSNHKELGRKYTALEQKCQGLVNSSNQLNLKHATDVEEQNRASQEIARLREDISDRNGERQYLQAKLDDLKALHIRSINSVGTGLEPVTDKTFEDNFRNLQDKVGDWSRKISKHKGEGHPTAAIDLTSVHRLPARVNDINRLKLAKLIETAAWDFLEDAVFSRWLPGFDEDAQEHLNGILHAVQLGDATSTRERAEYWRAYTASLLFQNFEIKRMFEARAKDLSNKFMASILVNAAPMERYTMALFEIVHSAIVVGAQMRCQRGIYEIDNAVQLGVPYDSSKMINQDFTDENEEYGDNSRVWCILSNGWVKRDHRSSESRMQVCKARVFIEVVREDIQEVSCY